MLASLTLSWLLWLCGRPDSELRSCSSLERKSHFQTEQWKVCQGQETGQYLYNKHNSLVILQRLCNFDTYIFDTSIIVIVVSSTSSAFIKPCNLILRFKCDQSWKICRNSPIAIAVLPVPGWPAMRTARPAIWPSLIISRISPAALRDASWPTIPWDTWWDRGSSFACYFDLNMQWAIFMLKTCVLSLVNQS